MWNFLAGLIPAGINAAASWFGAKKQAQSVSETNVANANLASYRMSWEENLANTAHQREVKDLKAAGLNPILSAKYGGSATPPAINTVMSPPYANYASHMVTSARNLAEVKLLTKQASLVNEELKRSKIDTKVREQIGKHELAGRSKRNLLKWSAIMKHIGRLLGGNVLGNAARMIK